MKALKNKSGQSLPFFLITMIFIIAVVFSNIEKMNHFRHKIQTQKQADAIALTAGAEMSRSFNALSGINHGIAKMANQFLIFTGVALASTYTLAQTGQGIRVLRASYKFTKGGIKLTSALETIGEDFDHQIQKIQNQFYKNVCSQLQKENALILSEVLKEALVFFKQQNNSISSDLFKSLQSAWSFKDMQFVQIHPNVCDPKIARTIPLWTRTSSTDGLTSCEKQTFTSYEQYQGYTNITYTHGSIEDARVVYQRMPPKTPITKELHFDSMTATSIQKHISVDKEGEIQPQGDVNYMFLEGTFTICKDVKKLWRNFSSRIVPIDIPDYIRLHPDFKKHNTFTIHLQKPVFRVTPYAKSTIMDLKDQKDLKTMIENIRELIQNKTDMIKAKSHFTLSGNPSLENMDFIPKFTSPPQRLENL